MSPKLTTHLAHILEGSAAGPCKRNAMTGGTRYNMVPKCYLKVIAKMPSVVLVLVSLALHEL